MPNALPSPRPGCRAAWLLFLLLPAPAPGAQALRPMPRPGEEAPAPLFTLAGHASGVFHVTYSPDGKYLATCSKDKTVRLWDAATGKAVRTLIGHSQDVYSSAFSPDGKLLASASEDRSVRVWEVATGNQLRSLVGHNGDVYGVAFSPDGKLLASAGSDQIVQLWNAADGKQLHTLKGHTSRVLTATFSPDGALLATACGMGNNNESTGSGGEVKVWDVASGRELFALPSGSTGVVTVAFSPDGRRLAGACIQQTVKVWEASTGQETLALKGHTLEVYHVAFSPDGRLLASCSGKWDQAKGGEVKVWDLATGRELVSFRAHATSIWSLAISPDQKRLVTCTGLLNKPQPGKPDPSEVKVWDLAAMLRGRVPPLPAVAAQDLDTLWKDLAATDSGRAYRAVWALGSSPRLAIPFLREQARPPASGLDPEYIDRLVAKLDDNSFEARERASAELERLGSAARPALQKALQSPSLEVRRRAERLLERKASAPPLSVEEMRALRVVEVLQHIGTPEVRPVLEKLARGPAGAPVTRAATAALGRLPR